MSSQDQSRRLPSVDDVVVLSKRAGTRLWRHNDQTGQLERVVNLSGGCEDIGVWPGERASITSEQQ